MAYKVEQCKVNGCRRPHRAKGYCKHHYSTTYTKIIKPHYKLWCDIKQRCYNINSPRYHDWGGRGITVFEEWINDYRRFAEYIGDKPTPFHQLDRIDNDKGYEPGNVRWATAETNSRNRRVNKTSVSGVKGVEYRHKQGYVARITINKKRINLGTFKTLEEASAARYNAEIKYDFYS